MKPGQVHDSISGPAPKKPTLVRAGGVQWYFDPETNVSAEELRLAIKAASGVTESTGRYGPPLDAILKKSRVRRVRMMTLPESGTRIVLKEYTPRGAGAALRTLMRGHPATREWRALRRLHEAGVSVPDPIAMGFPERKSPAGRAGFVAMRAVEDAAALEDLLLGKADAPLPRRIIAARLGRLVRAMHDAGVAHPDLHAANVLVSPDGALYLIDFHSAHVASGPIRGRDRILDLLSLSGAFLIYGRRSDRMRFFLAYSHAYSGDSMKRGEFRAAARDLEATAWKRLRRFLKKYDTRPLRAGRQFRRVRAPGWSGMAEKTERAERLAGLLLPDPGGILASRAQPLKTGATADVWSLPFEKDRYVVKVYHRTGPKGFFKALAGASRARSAWIKSHRLVHRGLKTARPVLYAARGAGVRACESMVVFEEAADRTTLDRFAAEADAAALRELTFQLARIVARMHFLCLTNRDLKAQNILVGCDGDPMIIDPDGVAAVREVSLHAAARDLMRINASFAPGGPVTNCDRMRFLAHYARVRGLGRAATARLRSETVRLTLAKRARWNRRQS